MTTDEVRTWYEVAQYLSSDVREALELAQPPELRGWWTEEEMLASTGRFVEITTMSDRKSRYLQC